MILDKVKLLNEGYLSFNLKDVDGDLYNTLHKNFNKETIINEIIKFRFDGALPLKHIIYLNDDIDDYITQLINELGLVVLTKNYYTCDSPELTAVSIKVGGTFESLKLFQKNIFSLQVSISQFWYFSGNSILNEHLNTIITNIYKKTIIELYSDDIILKEDVDESKLGHGTDLSLYIKDNFINSHNDGFNQNRLCVILIYLNDDYINGYGGELVINESVVVEPNFGNIAILDFTKNNPEHEVRKVIDDNFKRFAFIKFFYK